MVHQTYSIIAEDIGKRFGRDVLFRNINFTLHTGDAIAITGPNGSGKSTLMLITAGLRRADRGTVFHRQGDNEIPKEELYRHVGMVSPALMPYRELSAMENIQFALGNTSFDANRVHHTLEQFQLYQHRHKPVSQYSTGMLQRLKVILATCMNPGILFMDEPGSNLDTHGKDLVYGYIDAVRENTILCIATNEIHEAGLCQRSIELGTDNN